MNGKSSWQRCFPWSILCTIALLCPLSNRAPAGQHEPQSVFLEIDKEKITLGDFLLYLRQVNPLMDFAKLPPSEQRHWVDEFVDKKLFALRAREAHLDQTPEVRARIDFFVDGVLAQEFKDKVMRETVVTDEELAAYYRTNREEFRVPARVLLQHFLYKTSEKAAQALARLQQGAAFADLAKDKRSDSDVLLMEHTWFTPDLLIPELRESASRLPAGGVSDVIRSSYGFHVLRVEASEPSRYKDLAAVQTEIVAKVRQSKAALLYEQILNDTKSSHQVHLHFDRLQP
jgi:peptidyl-prolyl cis-trans isomerase C